MIGNHKDQKQEDVEMDYEQISPQEAKEIMEIGRNPFQMLPTGKESAVWVEPSQVCVVEYMIYQSKGFFTTISCGNTAFETTSYGMAKDF